MLTKEDSFDVSLEALSDERVSIVWGTTDRNYRLPERFRNLRTLQLPAAHHFPIAQPERTAQLLRQLQ
jgi:hypothetical protein